MNDRPSFSRQPTNQPVCQREIRIDGSLFLETELAHLACGLGRVVLRGAMESCMYAHHDSGAALRGTRSISIRQRRDYRLLCELMLYSLGY